MEDLGGLSMTPAIALHLLDSAQGHPLQTWTFEDRDSIMLGRAPECDVVLADPYVSRTHARLKLENDEWRVVSVSDRSIIFEGQPWSEVPLSEGTVFRLGKNGCFLRFGQDQSQPANSATITFSPQLMPVFELDKEKMQHEVSQIVDGQYFQQLKNATRQLREQRQMEQTGS
jgi:hypothetical protein